MSATSEKSAITSFRGQSLVRAGICVAMGMYLSVLGFATHGLYICFMSFTLLTVVAAYRFPKTALTVTWAFLTADLIFTIAGLHVVESNSTFLFVLLLQISFGYALRFGRAYLWIAVIESILGLAILFSVSPYWADRADVLATFALGAPLLSFYIDHLTIKLRRASDDATRFAAQSSNLLGFVSHDIRTLIFALKFSTEKGIRETNETTAKKQFEIILRTLDSVARLTSQFVQHHSLNKQEKNADGSSYQSHAYIDIAAWLGNLARPFASILSENKIVFELQTESLAFRSAKIPENESSRILTNFLANASRYAKEGWLKLSVKTLTSANGVDRILVIISNSVVNTSSNDSPSEYFGSGLGLNVCQELAKDIGADIFTAEEDDGSFCAGCCIPCSETESASHGSPRYAVAFVSGEESNYLLDDQRYCEHIDLFSFSDTWTIENLPAELKELLAFRISPITSTKDSQQSQFGHSVFEARAIDSDTSVRLGITAMRDTSDDRVFGFEFAKAYFGTTASGETFRNAQIGQLLYQKSILLADDNEVSRGISKMRLEHLGATVIESASVQETINHVRDSEFDLAIVDWFFPDGIGSDILDEIAVRFSSPIPIVVLSGIERAMIYGALEKYSNVYFVSRNEPESVFFKILHRAVGHDDLPNASMRISGAERVVDLRIFRGEFQSETASRLLNSLKTECERLLVSIASIEADGAHNGMHSIIHEIRGISESTGCDRLAKAVRQAEILEESSRSSEERAVVCRQLERELTLLRNYVELETLTC